MTITPIATVRHIPRPTYKHIALTRNYPAAYQLIVEEIELCTDVLYEAFGRKYFAFALDNNEAFFRPCVRAHLMSGVLGGEIHVVELPDAGIVGVAMWFGPGQRFFSAPEQRAAGWDELMDNVGEPYKGWWGYYLKLLFDVAEKYYGVGVQLNSYHLQLIGIHPKYQNMGCGTALFNFVEPRAASESRRVVLETLGYSVVPFYKGLGYAVFGPNDIRSPTGGKPLDGIWFEKRFD